MTIPLSLLSGANSSLVPASAEPPSSASKAESDYIVVLFVLICALICAACLVAIAHCTFIRRRLHEATLPTHLTTNPSPPPPLPNRGLKKKTLRSLPTYSYNASVNGKFAECAICLAEFVEGDNIRVLPRCGHVFHVNCIDTWLGSHSSCPSCRQTLGLARCQKCGGFRVSHGSGAHTGSERHVIGLNTRVDDSNRFLP